MVYSRQDALSSLLRTWKILDNKSFHGLWCQSTVALAVKEQILMKPNMGGGILPFIKYIYKIQHKEFKNLVPILILGLYWLKMHFKYFSPHSRSQANNWIKLL